MKQLIRTYLKKSPLLYRMSRSAYKLRYPTQEDILKRQIIKSMRKTSDVFFVQVGSNDGVQGDPIHDFILKYKWSGIFIEPVKVLFNRLKQNYDNGERFIFENVAIGTKKGIEKFYYVSDKAEVGLGEELPYWYDQLGSFNKQNIANALDGKLIPYIVEEEIECVPLAEILARNNVKKIDLLHIDAEGFDYNVLAQMDFSKYQPSVILYESKNLSDIEIKQAASLLKTNGYRLTDDGTDTLAVL